jgi:NADH dehydrogenase
VRQGRFGGPLAWFFWLFVHIAYLAGFRNRLIVLVEWAWEYFTYQRGVRLILGDSSQATLIPRADGATAGTRSESR